MTNSLRLRKVDIRPGHVTQIRRGPLGVMRDGAFLVVVDLVGLTLAGGMLAADRAVDASLPHVVVTVRDGMFSPAELTVVTGEWIVVELVNEDDVVRDWMIDGVPNLDIVARPGQTARLRFVLDTPGEYPVMGGGSSMGTGGEMAGMLVVEARRASPS